VRAITFSCAVFATTLHAQDFKDEEGDRFTGRRTLVTLFPTFACFSMMVVIPLWSFCLSRLWKVDDICSAAFVMYGMVVRARFVVYKTARADRQSCKLYSVSDPQDFENSAYSFIFLALVYHRTLTPRLLAIFLQHLKVIECSILY
jgi:hypothetical protein